MDCFSMLDQLATPMQLLAQTAGTIQDASTAAADPAVVPPWQTWIYNIAFVLAIFRVAICAEQLHQPRDPTAKCVGASGNDAGGDHRQFAVRLQRRLQNEARSRHEGWNEPHLQHQDADRRN